MVATGSDLVTATSALPELNSEAEELFTLLRPWVEVMLLAGIVLVSVPTALVVTSTANSQIAPELIDALLMPNVPVPGTALIRPVQVPLAFQY